MAVMYLTLYFVILFSSVSLIKLAVINLPLQAQLGQYLGSELIYRSIVEWLPKDWLCPNINSV